MADVRQMWHCHPVMLPTIIAVVVGVGAVPAKSTSVPPMSRHCPADAKLANLVAGSDLVLIGRMKVPEERLVEEARKPSPNYLDIPTQVESVVKGESAASATIRFYPSDASYKPSNDAVLNLGSKRAILFLTRVDEEPFGLYFAGYTPDALKPASDQAVAAVRAEMSRQAKIIASWAADRTLPHFGEVRALLVRLGHVSGEQQQKVFGELEELGEEAVPAIIAQMDDRRPLRTRDLSLVNRSRAAFERARHYGPEQVVDGLDAVLNQITGASFGSIVNGGSNRERDATVAGWRVFAADLACGASE